MSQRKILVVCQHFWPESFRINDLCDGFIENGLEVDVLCGQPNYPKGEWYDGYGPFRNRHQTHRGINIHRTFEIRRGNNSKLRICLNYFSFILSSLLHVPGLLKNQYDKIFIYELSPVYMAWAGILIGRLKKVEIITCVMDLWPENLYSVIPFKNKLIRNLLMRSSTWVYRKSDKLVCLTDSEVELLKGRTGKPDQAFCVIPQSCEKIYETPIYDEAIIKRFGGKFNVVFAGNINPAQDFPTMLDAAEQLHREQYPIHWIILGDGMSRKDVEREVEARGLTDIFSFEGLLPIADVPKYTPVASCLIACLIKSPLVECAIAAKVFSYIASGRPIVLAMDGEAGKLINENMCGFACASGNATALADCIKRVYNSTEEEREAMGERARELHFARFERDMNFRKLLRFMFDGEILARK